MLNILEIISFIILIISLGICIFNLRYLVKPMIKNTDSFLGALSFGMIKVLNYKIF